MKAQKQKKSLAETLVEIGLLSNEQVKEAQNQERESGQPFRRIIVQKGYVSEEDLISFMAAHMGLPRIELRNYIIDAKVIGLITEELARKHHIIPILKIGNSLTCAMFDPLNIFAIDELRNRTGFDIEPAVATEQEIKEALNQYYSVKGSIDEIVKTIDKERVGLKKGEEFDLKKLQEVSGEPPVVRLVNLTIMQAVTEGASDIHIEPEEDTVRIRYRIDGILYDRSPIPKYLQSAIISRIKILSELNIAEHRASQDGRFQIKIESRQIDIRVSVVATIFGENVVLRLLDRSSSILRLSQLGFSKEILGKYEKLILRPFGIILVTGPTGSGKTTTLYASLNLINSSQKNIITIEDPVEYHLDGIRQIQVEPKAGTTFATGLRSILRQDPDVIMVGEIRDRETAEIAIQASLTGHLVFSTLHTNDASSAVSRLIDMGIEPFLVSSALIGVLAQRLVRAICKECKEEYIPSEELMNDIGYKDNGQGAGIKFFKGKGCPKCSQSGHRGRIGIFELMPVDDALRSHITAKAPREEIKKQAEAMGIVSLKADGLRKAKDGITTVEEVLRLTQEE